MHLGVDKHMHKHDETLTLLVYRTRTPHTHALQIRMYIAKTKADTEIVRVKLRASDGNKHNIATSSSRHDTAENRTACNTPPSPLLPASLPHPKRNSLHTQTYTPHIQHEGLVLLVLSQPSDRHGRRRNRDNLSPPIHAASPPTSKY